MERWKEIDRLTVVCPFLRFSNPMKLCCGHVQLHIPYTVKIPIPIFLKKITFFYRYTEICMTLRPAVIGFIPGTTKITFHRSIFKIEFQLDLKWFYGCTGIVIWCIGEKIRPYHISMTVHICSEGFCNFSGVSIGFRNNNKAWSFRILITYTFITK